MSSEREAQEYAANARKEQARSIVGALKDEYLAQATRVDPAGKRRTREIAAALKRAGAEVPRVEVPRDVSDGKTVR